MSPLLWIIAVLAAAVVAYAIGRRTGIRQGYKIGYTAAPLDLRTQAFTSGICPLCHGEKNQLHTP